MEGLRLLSLLLITSMTTALPLFGDNGTDTGVNGKIYRGSESQKSYPFLVVIMEKQPNGDYEVYCGGSLLDETHVLTAGHCTEDMPDAMERGVEYLAVLAPTKVRFEPLRFKQSIVISSAHTYNKYQGGEGRKLLNDIGIVTLSENANIGPRNGIAKICIGSFKSYDNVKVKLIGFGNTQCKPNEPSTSDTLLEATGITYSYKTCKDRFNQDKGMDGILNQDSQICTTLTNRNNQRAEQGKGDSGGPLFQEITTASGTSYSQIGLVSSNVIMDGEKNEQGNPKNPCPNFKYPGLYFIPIKYKRFIQEFAKNANFNC